MLPSFYWSKGSSRYNYFQCSKELCCTQRGKDKQPLVHLNWLIDNANWKDSNYFIIEDSVLKLILGMDASLVNVDMLWKLCGKLGFTSHKFTKAVFYETIIKAVTDGKLYDAMDPESFSNVTDSTSLRGADCSMS